MYGLRSFWTLALLSVPLYSVMPPELPRIYINTDLPVQTGRVIPVHSGSDLQPAINAAEYGDTIVLQAGVTYTGSYTLPEKTGTGWIVIQSSDLSSMPASKRVTPLMAPHMPKLISPDFTSATLSAGAGAHHYRLIGLEIASNNTSATIIHYLLVALGVDTETNLSRVPHHLIIDRCYIHATPTGNVVRGVALNSRDTSIIDSYLSGFKTEGGDAQAIAGWGGPGPYKIVNNFLESSGENVMFGGSNMSLPNTLPSDIEIRYNHFYKPLNWQSSHSSYDGSRWLIKNLFELKNAQRVLFENNVLENNWGGQGQTGYGVLFNGVDGPTSTIENITFHYNYLKNSEQGFRVSANAYTNQLRPSNSISVQNNLFELNNGMAFGILTDVRDVQIDHQTVIGASNAMGTGGVIGGTNVRFTNNLVTHGDIGIQGYYTQNQSAVNSISYFFPGGTFIGNGLVGGDGQYYTHFPGNFFPADWNSVRLMNMTTGDYRIQTNSPFHLAGTDGKDLGADIEGLVLRIRGVTDGSPTIQPPPGNVPVTPGSGILNPHFTVQVHPNPWRRDRSQTEEIIFEWVNQTAALNLFTVSGHRIRTFQPTADQIRWDLRTDSGNRAASGLYLYTVERTDGQKARGKFAIVK